MKKLMFWSGIIMILQWWIIGIPAYTAWEISMYESGRAAEMVFGIYDSTSSVFLITMIGAIQLSMMFVGVVLAVLFRKNRHDPHL